MNKKEQFSQHETRSELDEPLRVQALHFAEGAVFGGLMSVVLSSALERGLGVSINTPKEILLFASTALVGGVTSWEMGGLRKKT